MEKIIKQTDLEIKKLISQGNFDPDPYFNQFNREFRVLYSRNGEYKKHILTKIFEYDRKEMRLTNNNLNLI